MTAILRVLRNVRVYFAMSKIKIDPYDLSSGNWTSIVCKTCADRFQMSCGDQDRELESAKTNKAISCFAGGA